VNNPNDFPITIADITIPARSTKEVKLGGESTALITYSGGSKTVAVKEFQKPHLIIECHTPLAGDEISVRDVKFNHKPSYRVIITGEFLDQLDIKITGPVSAVVSKQKRGEIDYDVNFTGFATKAEFDRYMDARNNPNEIVIPFTVTVTDKIAPPKLGRLQQIGQYRFTEW